MSGTRVEGYVRSDGIRVAGYYRGGSGSVERRKDGKIKTNASYKGARGRGEFQQDFNGRLRGNVSEVPLGKMLSLPGPLGDVMGAANLSTEGPGVAAGASLSSALGFAGISRAMDGTIQGKVKVDPKGIAKAIADQLNSVKSQATQAVTKTPEVLANAVQQTNLQARIEAMTPEERKQAIAANILQAAGFAAAYAALPGGPLVGAARTGRTVQQVVPALGAARPMLSAGRVVI
jgi:hypothetical protein